MWTKTVGASVSYNYNSIKFFTWYSFAANEHTSSGVSCYDLLLCRICIHDGPSLSGCNPHFLKHFTLHSADKAALPESHIPVWSGQAFCSSIDVTENVHLMACIVSQHNLLRWIVWKEWVVGGGKEWQRNGSWLGIGGKKTAGRGR